VSPDLVSRVTDVVADEITARQTRPAYLVTGVDVDGFKHVLGIWIGPSEGEGAKFWLSVLTEP
jgi:transposase-like protein